MAHPALVRFGGHILKTIAAGAAVTGTAILASAAPAVTAAAGALVLPAAVVVASGVGVGLVIKKLSSRL
jgi:hypothetical protein